MSLFANCESCGEVATRVCMNEEYRRFFCNSHAEDHSTQVALVSLSNLEVYLILDTYEDYKKSLLCQTIHKRYSQMEWHLQEIKRIDEECSSEIESINTWSMTKEVKEIVSYEALPTTSESPFVQSLSELKHDDNLSSSSIKDLLISLNSFHQSSIASVPSTQAISIQTNLPSTFSVKASSSPLLSIQTFLSQISIINQIDQTNCRWGDLRQTQAHDGWICSAAVSDCQNYVATASVDKTIKIWKIKGLRLIRTLKGHEEAVSSVTYLGDIVVSGSIDNKIKLWSKEHCIDTLTHHSEAVHCISVSSCKKYIASGSADKKVIVCMLEDRNYRQTLEHQNWVMLVLFSQDNKEIVSATDDGHIYIWNTESGILLKTIGAHSGTITGLKYLEKLIVTSSVDGTVKIWDGDCENALYIFSDHNNWVCSIDLKDNIIASLGADDRIIFRDINANKIIQVFQGHGNKSGDMSIQFLEEGIKTVSVGGDGMIKVLRRLN